jgi:hypothetical protein
MSSIINNDNSPINITESTRELTSNYGVAGTGPFLQDYSARLNVLLKDAIKARWDTDVGTPATSKMLFLTTWFSATKDIELIFRQGFEDKPALRGSRTIDVRLQKHIVTVDIHIGVRSGGGDIEPPVLNTVIKGLDKIIALNHTVLIPNAVVELVSTQEGPVERPDSRQTFWHVLCKTRISFWKARTS